MLGGCTLSQQDNAMSIDATQLPAWVQEVTVLAVAVVSVATAIWRYLKTQVKPSPARNSSKPEESVDYNRLIKEIKLLADVIEASDDEYARLTNRTLRSNQELRESIEELTQEIRAYNRKRNINATK